MNQQQAGEQQFDNFMENPSLDYGLRLFSYHHEDDLQEEQKNLTPVVKKKGRPKGLKSAKPKPQTKEQSQKSSKNTGHWLKQENKRYHWFLQIHSNHFIHRHLRRMDKIFKTMADFIGSRQAQQCRSHHQKMQKKYHSFFKIIKSLRNQFYLSCDPAHIRTDLQNNSIFQFDPLISEQTLENEKEPAVVEVHHSHEVKEEEPHMEMDLYKICPNRNFFLGDNYESGLHYQHF